MFLIIIYRTFPSKIIFLDAMKRRTDERHTKYEFIASLLRRAETGSRGEMKVDQMGKDITVPHYALLIHSFETRNEIIGHIPNEVPVCHAIGLPSEVKKLLLKYSDFALPQLHYEKLINYFQNSHKPSIYVPSFEIPPLYKGAICSRGNRMEYNDGKFSCIGGIESKEPLYQGLHDYRVLFDEWMTNRAFREFFFIDNVGLVNKS